MDGLKYHRIMLKLSGEALTPFGGLVPWAAFEKHTGILKQLAATCLTRFLDHCGPLFAAPALIRRNAVATKCAAPPELRRTPANCC